MSQSRGYTILAPFYDRLGSIFFGQALYRSAVQLLENPNRFSSILIVGGGTGRVLDFLEEQSFNGRVTYIELSRGMINKARSRKVSFEVEWKELDVHQLESGGEYDCIHMSFFLDQFSEQEVDYLLQKLDENKEKIWLIADFISPAKSRQKNLMWWMYRFFRTVTRINATQLPDIKAAFYNRGFSIINEDRSTHSMMRAWEFKHMNGDSKNGLG